MQHVRRMRCSIVTMIQSDSCVRYHTFVLAVNNNNNNNNNNNDLLTDPLQT